MSDTPKSRPYERPALERYGTFRELTRSGSGTPTCDAVFQIGSSSALPGDHLGRCYE